MSCCEACSVIRVEMMQVTSIIRTLTKYWPGATSKRMPTMTIAMAPAAWADVRPNIMLPSALGSRNSRLDR